MNLQLLPCCIKASESQWHEWCEWWGMRGIVWEQDGACGGGVAARHKRPLKFQPEDLILKS